MKRAFFILATVLALTGAASAQAPKAPVTATVTMAPGWVARPTSAPAPTTSAAFGCDARAPNVCHFRIFYTRGDRIVILPAGRKDKVPGVTIGGDYCMTLGKTPAYKCVRKVINDRYNS
ncbi:MAG: hypothetical protein QOD09_1624 [Bradyrhizobium sp.]|jgi:hypothetical protein|nr:hypothetical protein [Bradyrhizobium sp.]